MEEDNNNNNVDEQEEESAAKAANPKPSSTHKRTMPKNKRKFSRNIMRGTVRKGNKKHSNTYNTFSDAVANNEGSMASAASFPPDAKAAKKSTKAQLAKQLSYTSRDLTVSNKKIIMLQKQLVDNNHQHSNDLSAAEEKMAAKSEECIRLASLAQDRRREGNEALKRADDKVAAMSEDVSRQLEEAASKVAAAQADARSTIQAERRFTSHSTHMMGMRHKKELQRQSLSHEYAMKAKDQQITQAKQQSEEYHQEVETTHAELQRLKLKHQQVIDALKIDFKEHIRTQKANHIAEIAVKKREIMRLQYEGGEMMNIMNDVVGKLEEQEKVARVATKAAEKSTKLAAQRLEERNKCRDQWRDGKDELAAKEVEFAKQAEIVVEYEAAMEDMTEEYENAINDTMPNMFEKRFVKNVGKRGGTMQWMPHVDKLILEMLANRTPPTCIQKNILAMACVIHPNLKIVHELPSLNHIRNMRTILTSTSKTLAVYRLASAQRWIQLHTDETSRRHKTLLNVIVNVLDEDEELKSICLSCSLIAEDGTAEQQARAIIASFSEFAQLLDDWREATEQLYPNRTDLLSAIPLSSQMSPAKLLGGWISTDTCATARLMRPILIDGIKQFCRDELKMTNDEIEADPILEGNCWQHMRNIICNGIMKELCSHMHAALADDMEAIPSHLRINCSLDNLCRMSDKEFNKTANYDKGHGDEFIYWMEINRSGELLMPIVRALGGNRQDGAFEGSMPIYMGRQYFVAFLHDFLCSNDNDNILQFTLYITLRSVEVIAELRVASIFFIAIIVPMRWLAGKTHTLSHRKWGERSMPRALDLVYKAFLAIQDDGDKFLDEEFMMNIFQPLYGELPELEKYLTYYFEEKESNPVGTRSEEDRVLAIDGAVAELFYPSRMENRQSTPHCIPLAIRLASRGIAECIHPQKALHEHLSALNGKKSWEETSAEEKKRSLGIKANNDPSESAFACFSDAFGQGGTIRLDHAAGEGQARYNADYARPIKELVSGKQSKKKDEKPETNGLFHTLAPQLQNSLIFARKRKGRRDRSSFTESVRLQAAMKEKKKKVKLNKKLESADAALRDASYFFQQYHSERCDKTPKDAYDVFNKFTTPTARYRYVKEQIHMRLLGLGWTEAHHPYSKGGYVYTPEELMEHFVKTVLPLARTKTIPTEPPLKLPGLPTQLVNYTLGTKAHDNAELDDTEGEDQREFRRNTMKKREELEEKGFGDQLMEMQKHHWPIEELKSIKANKQKKRDKFRIDMLFEHTDQVTHEVFMVWSQGEVIEVKQITENEKKNEVVVIVKWDEEHVQDDEESTKEVLLKSKWNPNRAGKGAWRKDLRDKILVIE